MENKIIQIESIFKEDKTVEVLEPLKYDGQSWFNGKLRFFRETVNLDFDIQISKLYPLTIPNQNNLSIRFISEAINGYAYTFPDNSLCIHPPKSSDLRFKLLAEMDLVKEWIDKYYIKGLPNTRYSFLPYHFEKITKTNLIYIDSSIGYKENEFNYFEYVKFSSHVQFPNFFNTDNLICLNHHEKKSEWSKSFKSYYKGKHIKIKKGIWVFLSNELNIAINNINRQLPTNWLELETYLKEEHKKLIYDVVNSKQNQFDHNGSILLMIGYRVKVSNTTQWQLIKMDKEKCPIESFRLPNNKTIWKCKDLNIHWSNAENVSYHRYFGRGVLNPILAEAKVLVVGVGALGSILSETLVRGGCKNIDVVDYDFVQSGNICRSNYELKDIGRLKIASLQEKLINISPFVNVNIGLREFPKVLPNDKVNYKKIKNQLEKYDFIFDCSSDTDVLFVLDKMRLDTQILSLAISNKAKDLVCVTGTNLAKQKDFRFSRLTEEEFDLYEDVGCGYSTFRASYNDISVLMQYGIKKINKQLENEISLNSFVLSSEDNENGFQILVNDY